MIKIFEGGWACVRKKSNNITYRCKELKRCLKKTLIWIFYYCMMIRYIRGHRRTGNYLRQLHMCHILGYTVCNLKGSWCRSKTNISIANVCHHFDVWLINNIATLEVYFNAIFSLAFKMLFALSTTNSINATTK